MAILGVGQKRNSTVPRSAPPSRAYAVRVDWRALPVEISMRRSLLAFVATLLLGAGVALAQDYPARPVKIIVPFAAGGPADVYARFLAQRLGDTLGQPFVVEDRPGAG